MDISVDFGDVLKLMEPVLFFNQESRSHLDMVFLCEFLTALVSNDDIEVNAGLGQETFCDFAIRTSRGCNKDRFVGCCTFPCRSLRFRTILMDCCRNIGLRGLFSEELIWLIGLTFLELTGFTVVPVLDWTVISRNTGIDFGFFVADWAMEVLSG